jgi:hypothetical protein
MFIRCDCGMDVELKQSKSCKVKYDGYCTYCGMSFVVWTKKLTKSALDLLNKLV